MIIDFNGIAIDLTRKPIRTINLRIYPPDGRMKMSAPLQCPMRSITDFLNKKSQWIHHQRAKIHQQFASKEEPIQSGSCIPFKGEDYVLMIIEHDGPCHVVQREQFIYCYCRQEPSPDDVLRVLDRWYRKEINSLLPHLIKHWQSIIGVHVNEWGIKKMNTRWGSCNTQAHRIWLNLNLIKKPLQCLEYVLVHELVHLLEASHNHRFYQLMDKFLPNWRAANSLLESKNRR